MALINIQSESRPDLVDSRAPMPAAPIVYTNDGAVAWDEMWDTFCVLASQGGPPHCGTMLYAQHDADPSSAGYRNAVEEIIHGVRLVSGLTATPAAPGWIAVGCHSASQARWLCDQIMQENVEARHQGNSLWLPVGENFRVEKEVKNVITAVAKTTHYWNEHLASEVKTMLSWEEKLSSLRKRLRIWSE